MQIVNDDSMFYEDKLPRNVMVECNGKKYPFPVNATILDIYKITGAEATGNQANQTNVIPTMELTAPANNGEICREDIVRCTKLLNRDPGSNIDLVVGNEYRVLGIVKKNGTVIYYEVLDDKAPVQYRIQITPMECEFVRKGIKTHQKDMKFQTIETCPNCREPMVLIKDKNEYVGVCSCGMKLAKN